MVAVHRASTANRRGQPQTKFSKRSVQRDLLTSVVECHITSHVWSSARQPSDCVWCTTAEFLVPSPLILHTRHPPSPPHPDTPRAIARRIKAPSLGGAVAIPVDATNAITEQRKWSELSCSFPHAADSVSIWTLQDQREGSRFAYATRLM